MCNNYTSGIGFEGTGKGVSYFRLENMPHKMIIVTAILRNKY